MRVRIFGTLREFAADRELEVAVAAGDTVRAMLAQLTTEYPSLAEKVWDDDGNLKDGINVLINGRSFKFLEDAETVIHEGDELAIFPAVGGG
jgi:MoaD family protein